MKILLNKKILNRNSSKFLYMSVRYILFVSYICKRSLAYTKQLLKTTYDTILKNIESTIHTPYMLWLFCYIETRNRNWPKQRNTLLVPRKIVLVQYVWMLKRCSIKWWNCVYNFMDFLLHTTLHKGYAPTWTQSTYPSHIQRSLK